MPGAGGQKEEEGMAPVLKRECVSPHTCNSAAGWCVVELTAQVCVRWTQVQILALMLGSSVTLDKLAAFLSSVLVCKMGISLHLL